MDRKRRGLRIRGNSIQIDFFYRGIRCRETLRMNPTKNNLAHAGRRREAILYEISMGTFDYAKHFPDSRNVLMFGGRRPLTVKRMLEQWLDGKFHSCEYSTWKDYKSAIEFHLIPTFGDTLADNLTASDIRSWMGKLSISRKRINNVLVPLRGALADAHAEEIIDRNPMDRIKNLSHHPKEPDPFSLNEVSLILQACDGQIRNLLQFAFWTGLRTSELIALEWGDVDWNRKIIYIRRAIVRKRIKVPKTAAGTRDVKLLPLALAALADQKQHTALADGQVFHNPRTGQPWQTDAAIRRTAWKSALRRSGVRYRTPYQTRHTFASVALSSGENPMWVASQMGHKDWGMIRKIYGRWIPDADPAAGDKMAAVSSQERHKDAASD